MIEELLKLANHLDAKGLRKEANYLDGIIEKMADGLGVPEDATGAPKFFKLNQGSDGVSHLYVAMVDSVYYWLDKSLKIDEVLPGVWTEGCKEANVPAGSDRSKGGNMMCFEIKMALEKGQLEALDGPPDGAPVFAKPDAGLAPNEVAEVATEIAGEQPADKQIADEHLTNDPQAKPGTLDLKDLFRDNK